MTAKLIVRERLAFESGEIVEIKIWRVLRGVPPSRHEFKYALFYGRPGERLVLYDNERGKGDHRHYGGREEAYVFVTIDQLLADFRTYIERLRREPI